MLTLVKRKRERYLYAMPIRWTLRKVAKDKGFTGYSLAAETGISRQTIYKLMRANTATRIDGATLAALCKALKCQPGKLLHFDG